MKSRKYQRKKGKIVETIVTEKEMTMEEFQTHKVNVDGSIEKLEAAKAQELEKIAAHYDTLLAEALEIKDEMKKIKLV